MLDINLNHSLCQYVFYIASSSHLEIILIKLLTDVSPKIPTLYVY